MLSIRPLWWIPIAACVILGFLSFIPVDTSVDGTFLPYQSLIPMAPISSILIWIIGGGLFYMLGRWATTRPIRSP